MAAATLGLVAVKMPAGGHLSESLPIVCFRYSMLCSSAFGFPDLILAASHSLKYLLFPTFATRSYHEIGGEGAAALSGTFTCLTNLQELLLGCVVTS